MRYSACVNQLMRDLEISQDAYHSTLLSVASFNYHVQKITKSYDCEYNLNRHRIMIFYQQSHYTIIVEPLNECVKGKFEQVLEPPAITVFCKKTLFLCRSAKHAYMDTDPAYILREQVISWL